MAPSAMPDMSSQLAQLLNNASARNSSTPTNGASNGAGNTNSHNPVHSNGTNGTNGAVHPPESPKRMPIAIVGMSCRLPGDKEDVFTPDDLWRLCSRGRSGWSPIPKERFNHEAFYHPNPDKAGCYNPQGGHFLKSDISAFDAPFFNITEKEAIAMDPQQRLLLECTYEALEAAGMTKAQVAGQDIGVFVGGQVDFPSHSQIASLGSLLARISFADYELRNCRDLETAPMFQATGCAQSLLANRISYYFDFTGPSFTVDTACSSSLTALHVACQSLMSGESSAAVVASAHLNILPDYFVIMSMQGLFSKEGKSFAFDHRGNGFGRGEGIGCVILKPLDLAIADNDKIHAVIVGSGVNQDGRTKGITMPNGDAQMRLMNSVYKNAGLDPSETGYVEAHGTGTKVGDPIEATALHSVFGTGRTARNPLFVGSLKSNIGHLEGASGVVSIIKTAMMLEKGSIPPNCNFEAGNPSIPFEEWGIKVPNSQRPWPRGKKYASVNNFGFGGTNAHAVLAKAPVPSKKLIQGTNDTLATGEKAVQKRLFVLSANDKASLDAYSHDITVYLEQHPEVFEKSRLPNLAYTLGQRRSVLSYKIAIPARSSDELIQILVKKEVQPSRATKEPRIGFVFTGQGAQWNAMGRELLDAYPVFAGTMEKIDRYLLDLGADFSILNELSLDAESSRISLAHISQPACTAVQLALADLLRSWGIEPSAVAGHSSGEIGAAYAAGAMSLYDCMAIAYYRGQAIVSLKKKHPELKGSMMAVGMSPGDVRPMVKMLREGRVAVACINSPSMITASGDEEAINELQKLVEQKEKFNRKLRVDTAYHSHHMELVAEEYRNAIKHVNPIKSTGITFHSSLHGQLISIDNLGPDYWVRNLTHPVRFSDALDGMCKSTDGSAAFAVDLFMELGPHAVLEGSIKQTLKVIGGNAPKIPYISALHRGKDAVDTTMDLAAFAFMNGAILNFKAINSHLPGVKAPSLLIDLPRYRWNHAKKYWHESRIASKHVERPFARNDLIGTLTSYSNDLEPTWRNVVSADNMPWVRHHRMQEMIVYPMAGYLAAALEAAAQRAQLRNMTFDKFELREVTVSRPLVIQEGADIEVNITLRSHAEGTRKSSDVWDEFRIFSWAKDRSWIEHCRGLISTVKSADNNAVSGAQQSLDAQTALKLQIAAIQESCTTTVDTRQMYETLTAIGAGYGESFQGLENCRAQDQHALADLIVPDTASLMPMKHEPDFIIHPALLDQFIQIVWPIFGAGWKGLDLLYMPSFIKSMSISSEITRKAGDRMLVFGSGNPNAANPAPTKLSLFATLSESDKEPLIAMNDLIMSPVFSGSDMSASSGPREICYKTIWEPVGGEKQAAVALEYGKANGTSQLHGINGTTTPPQHWPEVAIVASEGNQEEIVSFLKGLFSDLTGCTPVVDTLSNINAEGKICIVISELGSSVVSSLTFPGFHNIQKIVSASAGILWTVRGAYTSSENPDAEMVIGMARSIRSETLLRFATLDLGSSPQLSQASTAETILQVFKSSFGPNMPPTGADMEYQERGGKLLVPRVVEDVEMNKFVHQETHETSAPDKQPFEQKGRPLKIAIETPGALDTLYFTDDLAVGTPLPDYEVEIEVKATSMNFKDIMISMGQLSSKYIGVECAGVISAIGSKVTDLTIGDRVCAMSEGAYSTYTRCLGTSVQKISPSMSFKDAATIPVVFCTAYYSLFDLGRLVEGERILIHAAAGGVGQAAILLAKMVGAEIFATVGSAAKKTFIMDQYDIPEENIFFSRNTSFAKAIRRVTNDEGVDVVLNSLAGDKLRETWDSLAHFGRFIEIGKTDIIGNSRLEMARFEHNAMFASVDLTVIAAERPRVMKRLLRNVFDLLSNGLVVPIKPITIFPIADVESAFRTLQGGKTMGKIVVVPQSHDQVKAVPRKTTDNLLNAHTTYIIIGGTGGLGRSMSKWMISKGAGNIVLVSRSAKVTGKIAELVEEARTYGARIVIKPCDVSSQEQVNKLINEDLCDLPPVSGVIHAAMVLHDVLFENMTYDQWSAVVQSKVAGTWNFHNALLSTPLDFFIMLSSAAGAVGNRGQAAYAAANCFLNAFAQFRNRLGLPGSSIDLTAVSDAGYLAENLERQKEVLENLGSETISEKEVLALVAAAVTGRMSTNCNNHCITGLKVAPEALGSLFWIHDAKFARLRTAAEAIAASSSLTSASAVVSLSASLKASKSVDMATHLICEALMAKVGAVLMVPREEMDASKTIKDYGLDSLNAIEIRNWITRELDASLQVLELLTSGNLKTLAETILKKSKRVKFEVSGIE